VVVALVYVALRVCGFTGGVRGKPRVCGSSSCIVALRVCSFTGDVDDNPTVEVLALVRCVKYCSGNRDNIVCDKQHDLYLIMCCANLISCE